MSNATAPALPTSPTPFQIQILASTYTLEVIAIIAVTFRVYFRLKQFKRITWTDAFLVFALAQQIGIQICNVFEVLLTLEQYQNKGIPKMATLDATFVTYPAFWCLRMSVALLYLEIFSFRSSRIIIYISIAVITIFMLIGFLWKAICTFPLYPKENALLLAFQKCVHYGFTALTMNCAVGLVFDLGAVLLPIVPILSLHMSKTKKFSVMFVFCLGWITVAASAIRLALAIKSLTGGPLKPGLQSNFTIFAAVEMHVGLMAASLLTLWRVIRQHILFPVSSKIQSWSSSVRRPSSSFKSKEKFDETGDSSKFSKFTSQNESSNNPEKSVVGKTVDVELSAADARSP